jgi:uncharacterized protein (TIGR03084 family)
VADLAAVLADLTAEGDVVQALVAPLPPEQWATATPASGWTIADQIAHLAWTDRVAHFAVSQSAGFDDVLAQIAADPDGYVDRAAHETATCPPSDLLAIWNDGRRRLAAALAALPGGTRLPWFGPPMSPTSMATARLMETWAHGLDVAEALGAPMSVTDRLRHVAHLGVRTRDFAFGVRGRTPPAEEFRIELTSPGGQPWAWGPADAEQRVTGPALDFCLLVAQRRHRADLGLVAIGPDADAWLDIAQAFAGRPGAGRAPAAAGTTHS